jgi:hypothetical protein
MEFDFFISHASEDKDSVVRPLALRLREYGYGIWYDEFVLRVGDSLTERIDYGLANSTVGLIVLSHNFISKPWPKRELAGLTARQLRESTRLIPIWHEIELNDVLRFSPPLADIKALQSRDGIEMLVQELFRAVPHSQSTSSDRTIEEAQEMLERPDYFLANRVALVALDKRVIQLIDRLRESGELPSNYRIHQHPYAMWEAVSKLKEIGRFNVPAAADLTFLRMVSDRSFSFAAQPVPEHEEAAKVVAQVSAILRMNPLV